MSKHIYIQAVWKLCAINPPTSLRCPRYKIPLKIWSRWLSMKSTPGYPRTWSDIYESVFPDLLRHSPRSRPAIPNFSATYSYISLRKLYCISVIRFTILSKLFVRPLIFSVKKGHLQKYASSRSLSERTSVTRDEWKFSNVVFFFLWKRSLKRLTVILFPYFLIHWISYCDAWISIFA